MEISYSIVEGMLHVKCLEKNNLFVIYSLLAAM